MMMIFLSFIASCIGCYIGIVVHNIKKEAKRIREFNKECEVSGDSTYLTLEVPKDKLEEDKLDLNKVLSLYPNKNEKTYELKLEPLAGKLPFSKCKKIADSYNATSLSIVYT